MILFLLLFFTFLQSAPLKDAVYDSTIYTIQLYRGDNPLTLPYLLLNEQQYLTLTFDKIGTEVISDYVIDFIHCNADWSPSTLLPIEFYDGIMPLFITDFQLSRGTLIPYVHYEIRFPEASSRFKVSGNYIVRVYRQSAPEEVVFMRRFVVIEPQVRIQPLFTWAQQQGRHRFQQLQFRLYLSNIPIENPQQDIKVAVLQNFRWSTAQWFYTPTYLYPNFWEYDLNTGMAFPGGNEFRRVDLRSVRRYAPSLRIYVTDSGYTAILKPDVPRTTIPYLRNPDLNGFYYIRSYDDNDSQLEGEYIWVTFLLDFEPFFNAPIYVMGWLSLWGNDSRFQMRYDPNLGYYRCDVLLKQGVYDYCYAVLTQQGWDETPLEGTHQETENFYTILVYFRRFSDQYDRLIGIRHVNYYD